MKRPSREINIFNVSALDLFAAAMGAFIIIAVILFPYYRKNIESVRQKDDAILRVQAQEKEIVRLIEQKEQLQKEHKRSQKENKQQQIENEQQQKENEQQQKENERALKEIRLSQTEKERLQTEKERLQTEKKRSQTENKRLRTEKKRLRTEKKRLQKEKQWLQKEKERLQKEKQQLQKEKQQLEETLDERMVKFALFGIPTRADSFVVLVDMSGSMKKYAVSMQNTVRQLTEQLDAQTTLQMIGYRDVDEHIDLRYWKSPGNLAPMTAAAKRSVIDFAAQLVHNFYGKTPTYAALQEALGYNADAVILITDGDPTDDITPDEIIQNITSQNGGKKEIHCVALGDYCNRPRFTKFLQDLAQGNKGGFIGMPK